MFDLEKHYSILDLLLVIFYLSVGLLLFFPDIDFWTRYIFGLAGSGGLVNAPSTVTNVFVRISIWGIIIGYINGFNFLKKRFSQYQSALTFLFFGWAGILVATLVLTPLITFSGKSTDLGYAIEIAFKLILGIVIIAGICSLIFGFKNYFKQNKVKSRNYFIWSLALFLNAGLMVVLVNIVSNFFGPKPVEVEYQVETDDGIKTVKMMGL